MKEHNKDILADLLSLLGYDGLAEDLTDEAVNITFTDAINHLEENKHMLDSDDDFTAYRKARHDIVQYFKFPQTKENMLYNSGGNVMWSLFRTSSERVTIYYHESGNFDILPAKSKHMELQEIAENWNPYTQQLTA